MNKIKFPIIISFIVFFVAVFVTAKRLEASILIIVPNPDAVEEQNELEKKRREWEENRADYESAKVIAKDPVRLGNRTYRPGNNLKLTHKVVVEEAQSRMNVLQKNN